MLGHMSGGEVKNPSLCSHLGGSSLSLETFWRHNNYAGFSLVGNVSQIGMWSSTLVLSQIYVTDHYEGVKCFSLQIYCRTMVLFMQKWNLVSSIPISLHSRASCHVAMVDVCSSRRGMVRGLIGANLYHHHRRCCHNPWLSWTCR